MKYSRINVRPPNSIFLEGENVVLVDGTYEGTPGVFLHLVDDVNWADIKEYNGVVRRHPVAWLAHARSATGAAGEIAKNLH